ncbi:STAS domain-containing protein [Streptomyces sp. cmx-4-9]|uniref:STAS domain-containing protein n=1 Tax=Streptomyces sp. cmx-4-9 TaxID=2790941 RepID=UPI00398071E0
MEQRVEVAPDVDGVRLITCTGDFDHDTLAPLRAAGAEAASDPTVRWIALDLTGLTLADSSMLSQLLFMLRTGRLVLVNRVPPALDWMFDVTGVRELFPVVGAADLRRAL